MNGGHQTFDDAEVIVDNFSQRSQAVGGAGSVGNDVLASIFVFRRTSHNHFLRTSGDVFTSSFVSQEQTSCFSDNVNTNFVPFQVSRITFSGNTDFFTVNDQMTVFHFNGTVETAVSGVIFQRLTGR